MMRQVFRTESDGRKVLIGHVRRQGAESGAAGTYFYSSVDPSGPVGQTDSYASARFLLGA